MTCRGFAFALGWLFAAPVASFGAPADPPKKEPAYQTTAPKYGLLRFGPAGKDHVWLVHDGDTLYVDRNGNGDLTEAGEKVPAAKLKDGQTVEEFGYSFEIGDLTVGGRTHKEVSVSVSSLARYSAPAVGNRPDVKAILAKDPKALVAMIRADVEMPGLKGSGVGGRIGFVAGFLDLKGILQFADKPADAPVVHLGGPLSVTFYDELPALRVGRGGEFMLVVGTPGTGPGTFASVVYQDTIPAGAKPTAEIVFAPAKPGDPPHREKFELPERC